MLVGFVMFLILGVALWLFPGAEKEDQGYRPEHMEAAYWILMSSTAVRLVAEVSRAWAGASWLGGLWWRPG